MDISAVNNIATSSMVQKQSMTHKEKVEDAAKQFESFFVYSMLEQTQPEVDMDSSFSGGAAEQAFRPLLNEYLANEIVEAGGIGLKDTIVNQINKYEEIENNVR